MVSAKSAEIVSKVKRMRPTNELEGLEELEAEPIVSSEADVATTIEEAQQKLDEAKKAFEETENDLKR